MAAAVPASRRRSSSSSSSSYSPSFGQSTPRDVIVATALEQYLMFDTLDVHTLEDARHKPKDAIQVAAGLLAPMMPIALRLIRHWSVS